MRLICAGILFSLLSLEAVAQPTLIFDQGKLSGATDVEILGEFYDVEFVDGTCAQFYDGCDESFDFFFTSEGVANEASRALAEQVFPGIAPTSIRGCSLNISDICDAFTPWNTLVTVSIARVIAPDDARFVGNGAIAANLDLNDSPFATYAIWSPSIDPPSRCGDGIDNDGDGFIDFPNDAGCSGLDDDNEADATLIFDSEGRVTGATNVPVLGQELSVEFRDGTCASLFDGCDEESDFFFTTEGTANEASRALAMHVLPALAPKVIEGCGPDAVATCAIYTPRDASAIASLALLVTPDDARFIGNTFFDPNLDLGSTNRSTFAIWRTSNLPPTSDAGSDQSIRAGDTVFLDGSSSFDDNTATVDLLYSWSFSSVPAGSSASITGEATITPNFVVDLPGAYTVQLVVTDEGGLSSAPDELVVSANNLAPTADAGDDQLVSVGTVVNLNGSASTDPESDPLTFSWSLDSVPFGSNVMLVGSDSVAPTLTPDLPGVYLVNLVVSDFIGEGEPDTVQITAATVGDFTEAQIVEGSNLVTNLTPNQVTTSGNQNALFNFLSQAVVAVQSNDIEEAINKLQKALARTDGCVLRGSPDSNGPGRDWVSDCSAQIEIYSFLSTALAELE
ncbi:MAG: PKD domain-containing protein [Gammaproteobacteria bacterium]|jgi:hypothetical protein